MTQANAVTSHDSTVSQSDDAEDLTPRRSLLPAAQKRQRIRSSSVSLSVAGRAERGEKMGVLKTVQIHARARHAFAPAESLALAKQSLLNGAISHSDQPDPPLLVRRNSTSAPLSPLVSPTLASAPLPPVDKEASTTAKEELPQPDVDPAAPQTVDPPVSPKETKDFFLKRLAEIAEARDYKAATDAIRVMLNNHKNLTVEHFNAAFNALLQSRSMGEPLNAIIRLYNSMLEKSVVPNVQTYDMLIHALTTRDWEIHRAVVSLDQRVKHLAFLSRDEVATLEADKGRIEKLKTEDNFPSAMSLFEGILAIGGKDQLKMGTYIRLLRSCAFHADVRAAIHVFAQLESMKHLKLTHLVYQNMILTFMNAGRVNECEEIFRSYLAACNDGRLVRHKGASAETGRHLQIQVWNTMIEAYFRFNVADKAIDLVGQMVSSSSNNAFAINETPVPASSTFSTVIAGFILNGDIKSALAWFDNLLAEEKAPINPFQGLDGRAMRPNSVAWHMILDSLAKEGMVDDLNRLYKILKTIYVEDHITIRAVDHFIVHRANMDNLDKLPREQALGALDWLVEDIASPPLPNVTDRWALMMDICLEYIKRGEYVVPFNLLSDFVVRKLEVITENAETPSAHQQVELQHVYLTICEALHRHLQTTNGQLPWLAGWTLTRLGVVLGLKPQARFAPYVIPTYSRARYVGEISYDDFRFEDWDIVLRFATYLELNAARGNPASLPLIPDEFGLGRVSSVLQDIASHGVPFDAFANDLRLEVLQILETQYAGEQGRTEFLKKLGPTYSEAAEDIDKLRFGALENDLSQPMEPLLQAESSSLSGSPNYTSSTYVDSETGSVSASSSGLAIHGLLTRSIEDLLESGPHHKPKLSQAYKVFEKNLRNKMVPEPSALARLIQTFGRAGDLERVRELYTVAQDVLPLLDPSVQLKAWSHIEDSMIIALSHAGHPDAGHVHRMRILDQGMTPSADAYGVLIQHVKDTTDDTSGAMALFREALERGVHLNLYLYNNIISKLSKARKADHALELFQQMKANGLTPSSITYGAVIGACARVGDVKSAEILFQEMIHSKNFKPRVPPYNTMMQLYTATKPSRTSALHYYNEMIQAGVKPSSHTYKVQCRFSSNIIDLSNFVSR